MRKEIDIYTYGQDILSISIFPEYENKKEYNIFFRGIFDKYGIIYQKTIYNNNLYIEISLKNIRIISDFLKKISELTNIKLDILPNNNLILKNNDAKKFLDKIYIGSDARYRDEKKYNCYLRWLNNKSNNIISFKTKKTLNEAIFPVKNKIGYDISIVKQIKKIGTNTFVYDTGIILKINFGYKIKITSKCSLINYGFILNNYLLKKDESIKIILTKIDNLKKIKLPFTGFNLTIEKIEIFELEEDIF